MRIVFFILIIAAVISCASIDNEKACKSYKKSGLQLGIWDMRCR